MPAWSSITQGDAFFAAFPRAIFAVRAAIEAQRALVGHDWPEEAPVKVRAGLHTGEAEVEDGRYVGLAVHRAQRIAAAAHGGQTLVSATTRDLVEDDLPERVRLRELGEFQLKDMERPERLVQLTADGLPADFPQPRQEAAPAPLEQLSRPHRRPGRFSPRLLWLLAPIAALAVVAVVASLRTGESERVAVPANSIAVIDPKSTEIMARVGVGRTPGPVAVGAGGIWVGNVDDGTISEIDPSTRQVVKTLSAGASPTFLATGFGFVWAESADDQVLRKIDPASGQVNAAIQLTRHPAAGEAGLAAGAGGIWTGQIDAKRPGYLVRVDPKTNVVHRTGVRVSLPKDAPEVKHDLSVGEGAVWLTSRFVQEVERIDPVRQRTGGVQSLPSPISKVVAGERAVWVALENGAVYKLDPETLEIADVARVSASPIIAIAVGAGAVWTANGGDSTVSRIEPESGKFRTIDVGGNPSGIAVGAGAVWVSVD
jgi:YVTN family beta-propeller protein